MLHLSPGPRRIANRGLADLEAALLPARVEVWVSSSGPGLLRDEVDGTVFEGAFEDAPLPASTWRVDRLDDLSARRRSFTVHRAVSAPALVESARLLGGRPAIRTVALDDSGFIMRFGWTRRRPLAMFAVLEGSGPNRVIAKSINRVDEQLPDLANIMDFATQTERECPVPVAFQGANGTVGSTPLVQGEAHLVSAIWAETETFVRVDGLEEGYESGLTAGLIADSLSLLNSPTVRHGQNRWQGLFGEYLLIGGPLDQRRIRLVEHYLAERFSLVLRS